MYAVVGGNWFGTNARENIAVGLEHIPTWIMIVFGALTEITYKRSPLAKMIERLAKRHSPEAFIKNMNVLLESSND